MGWTALLFAALLQEGQETLLRDVEQARPPADFDRSLAGVVSAQNGRAVCALHEAYLRCGKTLKALRKEVARLESIMEKNKGVYGSHGTLLKGDPIKHKIAEIDRNKTLAKISLVELYQGRVARGLENLRSADAEPDLIRLLARGRAHLRAHAALALGPSKSAAASDALLRAATKDPDPRVRVALAPGLAARPAGVPILEQYLRDPFWQVRIAAARALALAKDRSSTGALIGAIQKADGRERDEVNRSLAALTGVDKHGHAPAWKEWWDENKEAFLGGSYRPKMSERAEDRGKSTFYGVRIRSKRLVFLLDVSPSMKQTSTWKPRAKEETRLDVAKAELKRMLSQLPDDTEFNLILISREPVAVFERPRSGGRHRKKALAFVDGIDFRSGTDLWSSFRLAFRLFGDPAIDAKLPAREFDTIYVVTDGLPTSGITDPKILLERLRDLNRFRMVAIHAIALEPDMRAKDFLQAIAKTSGGRYVVR